MVSDKKCVKAVRNAYGFPFEKLDLTFNWPQGHAQGYNQD